MKKYMFIVMILLVTSAAHAASSLPGFVRISTAGPFDWLTAALNVSNNGSTVNEYFFVSYYTTADMITFTASDGRSSYFYCSINSLDSRYEKFKAVALGLAPGSIIQVRKTEGSEKCDYITHHTKSSYFD